MSDEKQKNKNEILFVGAGPGDPYLITVKGQMALQQADLVVYAGSLVPEAVMMWCPEKTQKVNSASMHLDEIVSLMCEHFEKGKNVVRLHTGDPSLYGAIAEQMERLEKKEIPYSVIPGVTAAFAAAASMKMEYTLPETTQTLILTRMEGRTKVPETEALERLAAHQASMAIYLSITLVEKVQAILESAYGKEGLCAIAFKVSHPEERIIYTTVDQLADTVAKEGITHQALIIVGKTIDAVKRGVKQKVKLPESKLYDKSFTHDYRKGA